MHAIVTCSVNTNGGTATAPKPRNTAGINQGLVRAGGQFGVAPVALLFPRIIEGTQGVSMSHGTPPGQGEKVLAVAHAASKLRAMDEAQKTGNDFDLDAAAREFQANKNEAIFTKIFEKLYPELTAFAEGRLKNRQDAEDVVVDFFGWLWNKSSEGCGEGHFRAFCFTCVWHRCLHVFRERTSFKSLLERFARLLLRPLIGQFQEQMIDPSCVSDANEFLTVVLSRLPDDKRLALELVDLRGLTPAEAAGIMGISED